MNEQNMDGLSRLELLRLIHEQDIQLARVEERFEAARETLKTQADEYARRLEELNHAHDEAIKDKEKFLDATVYQKSEDEHKAWRRLTDTRLDLMAGRDAGNLSRLALALAIIGMLIGLASLLIRIHG